MSTSRYIEQTLLSIIRTIMHSWFDAGLWDKKEKTTVRDVWDVPGALLNFAFQLQSWLLNEKWGLFNVEDDVWILMQAIGLRVYVI